MLKPGFPSEAQSAVFAVAHCGAVPDLPSRLQIRNRGVTTCRAQPACSIVGVAAVIVTHLFVRLLDRGGMGQHAPHASERSGTCRRRASTCAHPVEGALYKWGAAAMLRLEPSV